MFRRSAGSLVCAVLALLAAAQRLLADPLIYAFGKHAAEDAADFNDYAVGTNGAYQAMPGWDYVSGWGTPNLTPLMKDVDHGNTAPIQTG